MEFDLNVLQELPAGDGPAGDLALAAKCGYTYCTATCGPATCLTTGE